MAKAPRAQNGLFRLSSAGFELAASIIGFSALGFGFDRHYDTAPRGVLVGTCLGLVGGLYNLIRGALRATDRFDQKQDQGN
jgi:F0F1-type ATP synthase assembly protein I